MKTIELFNNDSPIYDPLCAIGYRYHCATSVTTRTHWEYGGITVGRDEVARAAGLTTREIMDWEIARDFEEHEAVRAECGEW